MLDVDTVGVPADKMRPEQAALDVDVVGAPAQRQQPKQAALDVDVVGARPARLRVEQLAQDVEVVGIPKSRETPERRAWDKDLFGIPGEALLQQFETGRQLVEDYTATLKNAGLRARAKLAQGLVADGILELAQANDSDLIIIGGQGDGAAGQSLGSVGQSVVTKTDIPVLVVR